MTTTPTSNPIPSEAPQDLKFNAGKIDEEVNSDLDYYIDRFGVHRLTNEGRNNITLEAIRSFGYITIDSFQLGATMTLPNQILRDTSTGEYYRWDGTFPKVVAAGSTPSNSGGIGSGKWLSVGDGALRSSLASSQDGLGDALVAIKQPAINSVARTQHDKNFEKVSVKDFGAKGDGVTDDTVAMQAAFTWVSGDSLGRVLSIPAGRYLLTNRIKVNTANAQMIIKGEGRAVTTLVWPSTATGHGLSFGDTVPFNALYIGGMTLNTKIVSSTSAIYAKANGGSPNSLHVYDMIAYGDGLLGTPTNGYFGGGMIMAIDTNAPLFEDLVFYGVDGSRSNFNLVSSGIYVQSLNFMTLVPRLVNVSCSYVAYGMFFDSVHVAGIEGIIIDGCNSMCTYGIKVTAENATNPAYTPPQVNISKTQVEFFDVGFDLNHVSAATLDCCTLLHRPDSVTLGTAINFNNVSRGSITNNYVEQRPATTLNGINVVGASYGITCTNNTFDIRAGNTCIIFTGTSYNCSQYLNKCVNTGTLYANSSTQARTNTDSPYLVNGESSVVVGSNTIMKTGSRTVTLSAGGAFTINWQAGFPNSISTVTLCSGDSAASSAAVSVTTLNTNGLLGMVSGGTAGSAARINYIAIGN